MKVLVLGGCGFIGSHVVDRLIDAGQTVRVLDRAPERFRPQLRDAEYVYGDVRDGNVLAEALADVDLVMHLVSATVPGTAALDPQADVRDNLIPTIALLEAMTKLAVPKLIYLSSGGTVYGVPQIVPTPESHPLRPMNSYGIVKVAIEHYIQMYASTKGISAAIVRPSNPYGPRQGHTGVQGVVATFLHRVLNDEPLHVWGDGSVVRDYIYVKDLAEICVAVGLTGATGTFNAGSGKGHSVNDVIETLRSATGRNIKVNYLSGRPIDVPQSVLDMSRAKAELDWEPTVSFQDGVQRLWHWLQEGRADKA